MDSVAAGLDPPIMVMTRGMFSDDADTMAGSTWLFEMLTSGATEENTLVMLVGVAGSRAATGTVGRCCRTDDIVVAAACDT